MKEKVYALAAFGGWVTIKGKIFFKESELPKYEEERIGDGGEWEEVSAEQVLDYYENC